MTIIIGAGISGLSAGHILKNECLILEQNARPGGLSGKYRVNGLAFDHGGHYFHFQNKTAVKEYVEKFHAFKAYQRNSKVFLLQRFIPFSLQYHLAYLPACWRAIILQEILRAGATQAANLREFLLANFGRHLLDLFFEPFLGKFYGRPLDELLANMDKGSIPIPSKDEVRRGAVEKKCFAEGFNPIFFYPRHAAQEFIESYSQPVRQRIRLNERITRVDRQRKKVYTDKGSYAYDNLINTMPLKEFLSILEPKAPFAWQRLDHLSTLVVNAVLARRRRHFHWLYLPEAATPFYRVGYYPEGGNTTAVYLEKTVRASDRLDRQQVLRDMALALAQTGMIACPDEILFHDLKKIPVSYVVFDREWPRLVPPALEFLRRQRIFSIGRYGSWNYSSMADDIQNARDTASLING
ncbi:MAG: NAD(P)-binding protein [Candidatus Aminicenantes bacterium]|nr:NAD(P)-binding protein [Candidatus Aminicenantes bacterium]